MIARTLETSLLENLFGKRAVILYGARQVGKTTLVEQILQNRSDVLYMNGEAADVQILLEKVTPTLWRQLLGQRTILFLDEAQSVSEVGLKLKLLIDAFPEISVIATGSSSFELAEKLNEPLTGRKWEFCLLPLSFQELTDHYGLLEEKRNLRMRLVFGSYPEVVTNEAQAKRILTELETSYLYKDVLRLDSIKKSDKLKRLVQAIAYQVGSEVSYNELAQLCGINQRTAERYIDVLEQAFVIFRLRPYSKNLRNELKKRPKIYFWDNGIRNAAIGSYTPLELRGGDEVGKLWENYMVSERRKYVLAHDLPATGYFWRTSDRQEIDYLEVCDDHLDAFEFKWNPRKKAAGFKAFRDAYKVDKINLVTPDNYHDFLLFDPPSKTKN